MNSYVSYFCEPGSLSMKENNNSITITRLSTIRMMVVFLNMMDHNFGGAIFLIVVPHFIMVKSLVPLSGQRQQSGQL